MPINNRSRFGQPNLPYADKKIYAGTDAFIDCAFLDHTGAPVTPTAITYRVDDLTNVQSMIPVTAVTPTGSTQTIQVPAASLVMSRQDQGSQICQVWITASMPDGSKANQVTIIELVGIATPC